jgi:hypothetical protein
MDRNRDFTDWCRANTRLSADCFFGWRHLRCSTTWCVCTCGCVQSRALSARLATLSPADLERERAIAAAELATYFRSLARQTAVAA